MPAAAPTPLPVRVLATLVLPVLLLVSACSGGATPAQPAPPAPAAPPPAAAPRVSLPPDPLLRFVPGPADVPPGLLPVVAGSGPRDLAAVAAFSADPGAARQALQQHGFRRAYVAQYAEPVRQGAVLSAVVAEFATLPGAADDLAGDVAAAGTAEPVPPAALGGGQGGSLQTGPLPGGTGTLTTLRFRLGTRTVLLASGAPRSDPELLRRLARLVAERTA